MMMAVLKNVLLWTQFQRIVSDKAMLDEKKLRDLDTFDIFLQLYSDDTCKFQSESMLLTPDVCYANKYEFPPAPPLISIKDPDTGEMTQVLSDDFRR